MLSVVLLDVVLWRLLLLLMLKLAYEFVSDVESSSVYVSFTILVFILKRLTVSSLYLSCSSKR